MLCHVFDVDAFGVSHRVERGVAVESAQFGAFALNPEAVYKLAQGLFDAVARAHVRLFAPAVGVGHGAHAVAY